MIVALRGECPPDVTVPLSFAPGEAAQVDFGAGPMLMHPAGMLRRTWAFVMTLCFSRHQYVEFVWDQTVATWLGCHRRAFEWFACVPLRLIIDNAKCAIVKACIYDPGDFVFGPRKLCEQAIETRGGTISGVNKKLHYLVVGGLGSAEWKHGSFGTKIEKAIQHKEAGVPLFIVHEGTWAASLRG